MIDKFAGDYFTARRGEEFAILLFDVPAILNCLDNVGVGAGPADAFGFKRLDQGSFGISGRRRSEFLLRRNVQRSDNLAHFQFWQELILTTLGHAEYPVKAVKDEHAAV